MNSPALLTSDIHGDREGAELIRKAAAHFKADRIISAGDQCPDPYDPFYSSLIAVRGNCDRFYEYISMPFPPASRVIGLNGRKLFVTHGDSLTLQDFPLECGDIFMSGHTHIPDLRLINGIYCVNPGSPSRPRSSLGPTAALLDEDGILLFSLLDFSHISALSFSSL